jgi:hypothetical protein
MQEIDDQSNDSIGDGQIFLLLNSFMSTMMTMRPIAIALRQSQRLVLPSHRLFFVRSLSKTTDLSKHTLNCDLALKKREEDLAFHDLSAEQVSVLQGIGPVHLEALHALGIKTVKDLANYKFYHLAKAIQTMATVEEENGRTKTSNMNINKGVDTKYETKSFKELVDAPVSALQGVSEEKAKDFKKCEVTTIADLANLRFCKWAEAFIELAKFEEKV